MKFIIDFISFANLAHFALENLSPWKHSPMNKQVTFPVSWKASSKYKPKAFPTSDKMPLGNSLTILL